MTHIMMRFNILLVVGGMLAASTGASLAVARQEKPQVVEISVERFSFTPSEFKVKAGAPVEIRLRSDDTDHGFRVHDRHGFHVEGTASPHRAVVKLSSEWVPRPPVAFDRHHFQQVACAVWSQLEHMPRRTLVLGDVAGIQVVGDGMGDVRIGDPVLACRVVDFHPSKHIVIRKVCRSAVQRSSPRASRGPPSRT